MIERLRAKPELITAARVGAMFHVDPRVYLAGSEEDRAILAAAYSVAADDEDKRWKKPKGG